jgi:hypothetical protein
VRNPLRKNPKALARKKIFLREDKEGKKKNLNWSPKIPNSSQLKKILHKFQL